MGDVSSPFVQEHIMKGAFARLSLKSSASRKLDRAMKMIGKDTKTSLPLLVSLPEHLDSISAMRDDLGLDAPEFKLATKLFRKKLPPLTRPQCLPYLLGVSHKLIGLMIIKTDEFYRVYKVEKQGGGTRTIQAPRRFLKIIQRWIYERILSKADISECATGFVAGRSIFDNGKVHAGNGNLMVIDVKDFFPSIKLNEVEKVFSSFGYPPRVSYQLARLCCLNGRLPQGAPTSPAIANIVCKQMDEDLSEIAREWGARYTRYADDLAFSGPNMFNQAHILEVTDVLKRFGFRTNTRKTRILGRGSRQIVAGLVVNEKCLPPRTVRRNWRAGFHNAENHPHQFGTQVSRLFGIAAFINQYSPELAASYRIVAEKVATQSKQ